MGEGTVAVASTDALPTDSLLSQACGHLCQVKELTPRTRDCHGDGGIRLVGILSNDLDTPVTGLVEPVEQLGLEGLLDAHTGPGFELVGAEVLDKLVGIVHSVIKYAFDLLCSFGGDLDIGEPDGHTPVLQHL